MGQDVNSARIDERWEYRLINCDDVHIAVEEGIAQDDTTDTAWMGFDGWVHGGHPRREGRETHRN